MQALIKMVSEKTGISEAQATTAVNTVIGFLKDKMPAGTLAPACPMSLRKAHRQRQRMFGERRSIQRNLHHANHDNPPNPLWFTRRHRSTGRNPR